MAEFGGLKINWGGAVADQVLHSAPEHTAIPILFTGCEDALQTTNPEEQSASARSEQLQAAHQWVHLAALETTENAYRKHSSFPCID